MGTSHTYRYVSVSVSSPSLTNFVSTASVSIGAGASKSITATGLSSIRYIFVDPKWGQSHAACYYSTNGSSFSELISLSYFALSSVSGNVITFKNKDSSSCNIPTGKLVVVGY